MNEDLSVKEPSQTLVVNFFGGPGSGKSVMATGLFTMLKLSGIAAEYISEYAKDKTYQSDFEALSCQPYVTAKQLFRVYRVNNKVDVMVTDSPFILGTVYQGFGCTENWEKWIIEHYNQYWNLNINMIRPDAYQKYGRKQKEDEAVQLDKDILMILEKYDIPFETVPANGWDTIQGLYLKVLNLLSKDVTTSALVRPLVP